MVEILTKKSKCTNEELCRTCYFKNPFLYYSFNIYSETFDAKILEFNQRYTFEMNTS